MQTHSTCLLAHTSAVVNLSGQVQGLTREQQATKQFFGQVMRTMKETKDAQAVYAAKGTDGM